MDNLILIAVLATIIAIVASLFFKKDSSSKSSSKSAPAAEKKPKVFTIRHDLTAEEVAKHNNRNDCWIIVDNNVYDVTDYIDDHPGGDAIMNHAGGDSTEGAHGPQHPPSMWDVLKLYYIGELQK